MRALARIGVACALPLALLTTYDAAAASTESAIVAGQVVVELDQSDVAASPGQKVTFESTVRNTGDRPLPDYVAHLNILSTDKSVYVDPEDWSEDRTKFMAPLAPGESANLNWKVKAVTGGRVAIYVAVLPQAGRPAISPAMNVRIEDTKDLNSGGVLPLALGVPALLGAGTVVLRRRRAR